MWSIFIIILGTCIGGLLGVALVYVAAGILIGAGYTVGGVACGILYAGGWIWDKLLEPLCDSLLTWFKRVTGITKRYRRKMKLFAETKPKRIIFYEGDPDYPKAVPMILETKQLLIPDRRAYKHLKQYCAEHGYEMPPEPLKRGAVKRLSARRIARLYKKYKLNIRPYNGEINKYTIRAYIDKGAYQIYYMTKKSTNYWPIYGDKYVFKNELYSYVPEDADIRFDFSDEPAQGGIIVLLTDVLVDVPEWSAEARLSKQTDIIDTIDFALRRFVEDRADHDDVSKEDTGIHYSPAGHYFEGDYTARDGKRFAKESFAVKVTGVNFDDLVQIAERLCRQFGDQPMLVKDFSSGNIVITNPNLRRLMNK